MFILANMWFQTLMRQFFFNIDKIVYGFISIIYDFLIDLARTSVLSQADIMSMADRIYKLLALFMIFKVTFSLIMYVVNPDDFSDKNKGVSKLGTNIVIALALLILTPYIFNYAFQFQTIILEDNSLSALIFGEEQDNANESPFETAGEKMAYITMSPFFAPNASIKELYECAQLTVRDANGDVIFNESCSGLDPQMNSTNDSESLMALTDGNDKFTEQTLKNYVAGVSVANFDLMFRQDMAIATTAGDEETEFIMDYKYLFSTVLGVVIILLLVTFCMDVALRSIKLAFLQLIAPIPIISFVDPKSGKDGLFKKWYEMCFKTYISLFIRLIAIYFAAFIISKLDKLVDVIDGSYKSSLLLQVFIIIGALMFAKQLPKILEGLGIKLDGGGFTLNPLKKIEDEMLGGKQVSKGAKTLGKYAGRTAKGLGTAALVGGASIVTGQGLRGKAMGSAMMGSLKGKKFGENFSNSYKAARSRKKELEKMEAEGLTPSDVRKEKMYNAFHGTTRAEKVKQLESKAKAIQSHYDTIKNQAIACDGTDANTTTRTDANGNVRTLKSAKTISKELDEMKKTQIDRASFNDIEGKTALQQYNESVTSCNARIDSLQAKKTEYQEKRSEINLELMDLKQKQQNLDRSNFASDNDFYEARAAYSTSIAVLENKMNSYDLNSVEQEISDTIAERDNLDVNNFDDIEGKTADEQYNEAVSKQNEEIKAKEADLEERIKQLANGTVQTGVASADKVIAEAADAMEQLAVSINKEGTELGKALDSKFETMKADRSDVVQMMKTSKGVTAQTTTGKFAKATDIAQYTGEGK